MSEALFCAIDVLEEGRKRFESGELKSVPFADLRGNALAEALRSMSKDFGVTLREPLHIDSNGEFSLVVMPADGRNPDHYGTGPYGDEFVAILNRHHPRTGVTAGGTLLSENGWCRMNHFEVEKMVIDYAADLKRKQQNKPR